MIRKFFEKDSVLKVVSVFIAVLVWLYVIYIEDPEVEMTIDDVPVLYKAAEVSNGLSLVDYDVKTIDVKISASRSDIIQFEDDEIEAYLDLRSISKAGEYDNVKISVSTSNKNVEIIDRSEKMSFVQMDDIVSKNVSIGVELTGQTKKGYIVSSEPVVFIDRTTVTGPRTYVDEVKQAFIRIDCSQLTESKTVSSDVYLLDNDNKMIDNEHKAYKFLTLSNKKSSAFVTVSETKFAEVIVTDGDKDKKYIVSPSNVEIYSPDKSINKIYTESIKGKKADKDGKVTLNLNVPENVTLVSNESTVSVKIKNN